MDKRTKDALTAKVQQAIIDAVDAHWEETNKTAVEARKLVEAARKKSKKTIHTGNWVESYDLKVRHFGTHYGRSAEVSILGCKRTYSIDQQPSWHDQKGKQQFRVMCHENNERDDWHVETITDFEAAIQKSVVALIGHAYYNGE